MANGCRRESFTLVARVDFVKVPSARDLSEECVEIMRQIYDATPSTEVVVTRAGETIFIASAFAGHAIAMGWDPDSLLLELDAQRFSTPGQVVFDHYV